MSLRQIFSLPKEAPLIGFARHGHSLANEIIEIDNLLTEEFRADHYQFPFPDHKIPLTNRGRREARRLGRLLAKYFPPDDPIDRILVSPFKRTRQSTTEIKRVLHLPKPPTLIMPQLAERSRGDYYGYSNKGLEKIHPGFLDKWHNPEQGMTLEWPNGTTAKDFINLLTEFTNDILLPMPGVTLVKSHSFAITCMEVVIEQPQPSEALRIYGQRRLKNCEVSFFTRRTPDSPFERLPTGELF